jgi:nitrate/nitrite transport system ATP-binding protein
MTPFIEIRGIAKSFAGPRGSLPVLRNASLEVKHGEFVSVLGAMGSGKSTFLSIVAGLTAPDAGSVVIDGEPVRGIRNDAAVVFQNYSLLPWFSALENVRLAVGAAFPSESADRQKERARRALESVGLGNALSRRPGQLSGGMRQRVAIARAFATEPAILFMDEPFGALDALTRETLQQELSRLCAARERPVTTLMITNNVEEAILLSDRIVPMVGSAPATLGAPIPVDLPRPRTVAQLAHDAQASHVRTHVVATLTASLGRNRRQNVPATQASTVLEPAAEKTR